MTAEIYHYQFTPDTPAQEIEETLTLAILAAECLHGQSRVRLDVSYCMDSDRRTCVVDAGDDVGRDIVRIFTGFAIHEFGEEAFRVCKVERGPEVQPPDRPP